jgi:3-dehydroquinate synthetase
VLRAGCKRHSHKLNRSDFSSLLKEILKCTVIRKNTFFKTLNTHTDAIDRAFVLLEERRIEYFDDATIQAILSGGE